MWHPKKGKSEIVGARKERVKRVAQRRKVCYAHEDSFLWSTL